MTMSHLRDVILNDFSKSMPFDFDRTNVIVHTGGGVTHLATALFNHFRKTNTTVLMFAPTYTSFLYCASSIGCNVRLMKPTMDGMITPEHIIHSVDSNPDIAYIFLPNPNNPTGQYYNRDELEKIARLAFTRNLVIISDEVFHKLVYERRNPFVTIASIEVDGKRMLERTIVLRSVSKDHGLAALRSGYAIGPKELMDTLEINMFTFGTIFNVDDLAQLVTIAALSHTSEEYYQAQRELLLCHRDLVIALIKEINLTVGYDALKTTTPLAGIFLLIDASGLRDRVYHGRVLDNDLTLYELLLQQEHAVALLPASCGGYATTDMKLRLTLSSSEADIRLGLQRLSSFVQKVSHSHA
jgi:aspartate aminotransferase